MKVFDIKSLVLGALLGAVIVFSVAAATKDRGRAIWEYKIIPGKVLQGELEKAINTTVAEGWDFVSASQMNAEGQPWAFAVLRRERK